MSRLAVGGRFEPSYTFPWLKNKIKSQFCLWHNVLLIGEKSHKFKKKMKKKYSIQNIWPKRRNTNSKFPFCCSLSIPDLPCTVNQNEPKLFKDLTYCLPLKTPRFSRKPKKFKLYTGTLNQLKVPNSLFHLQFTRKEK